MKNKNFICRAACRFFAAMVVIFLAVVTLPPSTPGAGSPLDRFTPEQREKLLAGEPVFQHVKTSEGNEKVEGHGEAYIIIDKPVDYCFKIFCEFDKHQLYFPRKKKSEIVSRSGNKVLVYKEFDFALAKIKYTVLYTVDAEKHRVDFQLDPNYPHDINDAAGYFLFEKTSPEKTLFTYAATKVDTGIQVPKVIQDYMTSRDLPNVVISAKKRIESGGTWTKKD